MRALIYFCPMKPTNRFLILISVITFGLFISGIASSTASSKASVKSSNGSVLKLSKSAALNPNGEDIVVDGSGFNTKAGVYVALCKLVKQGTKPGPCGGGADLSGASGASVWISSNPPAYGAGVAVPFTNAGEFTVKLRVGAKIGKIDCRKVKCAVYVRADHMRGDDRSSDLAVPVKFAKKGKAVTPFVPMAQATPITSPAAGPSQSPAATSQERAKNVVVATTATGVVLKTAGMPPFLKISAPTFFTVSSSSGVTPIVTIDATNTKGNCSVIPKDNGYQVSAVDGTQCVVVVTVPGNEKYETGVGIYPFIIQP